MPFRDPEWENFQRDCDFFPAFSDYIFGIDDRPEVADEPGLHPQIYDPPPPPLPRQRLLGLPPHEQNPATFDPVRNAIQARPYTTSKLRSTSLLQQKSSMESMQSTPCPAPSVLPPTSTLPALLRPNELLADDQYSYIHPLERLHIDGRIGQAWAVINSDAIPPQKVKAMSYIRSVSNVAAVKRQGYQAYGTSTMEIMVPEQEPRGYNATIQTQMPQQQHASLQSSGFQSSKIQEDIFGVHEYAVHDVSQLPAYVHSRFPELWACVEATMLGKPLTTPEQRNYHRQAAQRMMSLIFSVPPKWRKYTQVIIKAMANLHKQGGDPMTMLHHLPRVEEVFETQQET